MKFFLLITSFVFTSFVGHAQNKALNSLPAGKYETVVKQNQGKWTKGDIILLDDSHYRLTSDKEEGEYRFSATAQRIFFISGPLKTVFAKTALSSGKPVIIIPAAENEEKGMKVATADVWAYLKQ